ncbi:hypothetical protein ACMU_14575 [Actibacterium mucosum KCTC 23349]|uniref:Uncharacterized protein n=1 Tax=Actibacterium mucosum KCTC 23349 TaxID=1454373 RepID=A0A037ZJJ7_9RHOB|nr:hypothetical protein [Actibacterium mucosum]KAJ54981.1 hypothetical protein ACMU_14575 [Actibacterium mucosum KCTC 23349]
MPIVVLLLELTELACFCLPAWFVIRNATSLWRVPLAVLTAIGASFVVAIPFLWLLVVVMFPEKFQDAGQGMFASLGLVGIAALGRVLENGLLFFLIGIAAVQRVALNTMDHARRAKAI